VLCVLLGRASGPNSRPGVQPGRRAGAFSGGQGLRPVPAGSGQSEPPGERSGVQPGGHSRPQSACRMARPGRASVQDVHAGGGLLCRHQRRMGGQGLPWSTLGGRACVFREAGYVAGRRSGGPARRAAPGSPAAQPAPAGLTLSARPQASSRAYSPATHNRHQPVCVWSRTGRGAFSEPERSRRPAFSRSEARKTWPGRSVQPK